MNKVIPIIVTIAIVLGVGVLLGGQDRRGLDATSTGLKPNVEIRDGIQYVTIEARGGYSPKVSEARANVPTKLIVKTNNTYDCSVALVIRSIGYQKVLSQTGEEIIDLGQPKAGRIQGLCSMGMYNFLINFK